VGLWILAAALLAVFLLAFLAKSKTQKRTADEWPVFAKPVLSQNEQAVYAKLVRAMPAHVVLAQVALSQVVGVKKGGNFGAVFNRYNRLVADFVVCRKDFSVLAVVELDDRHHDHPRRQDADRRKGAVLAAAGIPVVRINAAAVPSEDELANTLSSMAPIAVK
jgi:hypothetical protein